MKFVANKFYPVTLDSQGFENLFNTNHSHENRLNIAYLYRIWYILGSLCLAFAYIIHRRDELYENCYAKSTRAMMGPHVSSTNSLRKPFVTLNRSANQAAFLLLQISS
jgi:hypothetical protein